jgi:hypothetical protein
LKVGLQLHDLGILIVIEHLLGDLVAIGAPYVRVDDLDAVDGVRVRHVATFSLDLEVTETGTFVVSLLGLLALRSVVVELCVDYRPTLQLNVVLDVPELWLKETQELCACYRHRSFS